jgi:hypothetical protein
MTNAREIVKSWAGLESFFNNPAVALEAMERVMPVEAVIQACLETRRPKDFTGRCRKLPVCAVVWLLVLLTLRRRTGQENVFAGVLHHGLFDSLWKGVAPCGKAFAKAKDRVRRETLLVLFEKLRDKYAAQAKGLCFHGWRVLALDGSGAKTPDSECCRESFGAQPSSRGRTAFPQGRGLAMVCCGTRLVLEQVFGAYEEGELTLFKRMPKGMLKGALILMDRGFPDRGVLGAIIAAGGQFLVRLPKNRVFETVEELGPNGSLVKYRGEPGSGRLRLLRYRVGEIGVKGGGGEEIRLLTSLTDREIADLKLCELYHRRWGAETVFDEIKTHMLERNTVTDPVLFRGKTPERVHNEWLALLITYNGLRMLMWEAAGKHPAASGGDPLRLSFTAAVETTRNAVRDMGRAATGDLPAIYDRLLNDIARRTVFARPGRHVERAVKIKMSKYKCKKGVAQEVHDNS